MINFADEPTIKDYLKSCRRHWWIIAATVGLALVIGLQMAFLKAPTYKASAQVLADTSTTTTKDYVGRMDAPEVIRVVDLLGAQVLSTESLGELASEFNLYPRMRETHTAKERIDTLRSAIETEVVGFDTFRVHFVYTDPETAATIANRLAGMFVEEQERQRESNGDATNRLLSAELARMSADLKTKDNAIKQYRIANMGSLPDETEGNNRAVERWQSDLRLNTQSLERARHRLSLARASTPEIFQGEPIEALQAEIAGLEAERRELNRLIARSEKLLARAGEVEGTLQEMQREYLSAVGAYDDMLRSRQEAALRVGLDRARFDSLFRVVEPAVAPKKRHSPVRSLTLAVALIAGLLVGVALAVIRDYFDESFHERAELARHTGLPVVAAVPRHGRLLAQRPQTLKP